MLPHGGAISKNMAAGLQGIKICNLNVVNGSSEHGRLASVFIYVTQEQMKDLRFINKYCENQKSEQSTIFGEHKI